MSKREGAGVSKREGAGAVNRRMVIQHQERVSDGAGGYTESWETWETLWAGFEPLRGRERLEAMANNLEIVGRVKVRYREDLPIPARFVLGFRVMESIGPWIDMDDRREWAVYDVRESQVPELVEDGS